MKPHRVGRRVTAVLAAAILGSGLAGLVTAAPASANHVVTNCNNDGGGLDEVFVEAAGVLFVGVDLGLGGTGTASKAVCVAVGGTVENFIIDLTDPNTAATGRSVRIRRCNPTCTTVLDHTGVEVGAVTPTIDGPGGGTIGASVNVAGLCVYVDGGPFCFSGATGATVAEGDLPRVDTTSGICLVSSGGTCLVRAPLVKAGQDTTRPTVTVNLLGTSLPADVPALCVGLGC